MLCKKKIIPQKRGKIKLMEKLQELKKDNAAAVEVMDCGKKLVEFKKLGNKFKIGIMS